MKKLDRFRKYAEAIGVAIGAYLVRVVLQQSGTLIPDTLLILIAIALVLGAAKTCEFFAGELLDRWYLLRRLIAGDTFVEGDWLALTKDNVSVVSIRIDDGKLRIDGQAFYNDGTQYDWKSVITSFDGTSLEYLYRTAHRGDCSAHREDFGYSSLTFTRSPHGTAPNRYSGTYMNLNEQNIQHFIRATRLSTEKAEAIRADPSSAKHQSDLLLSDMPKPDINDEIPANQAKKDA